MTREEIISGLQMTMDLIQFDPGTGNVRPIYELNDLDKTTYVACKKAIEALKAQMDRDTISRQDAIDAVEKSRRLNHHRNRKEACAHEYEHRHFLKILRDLPPAQPEPPESEELDFVQPHKKIGVQLEITQPEQKTEKWILCSERLPEKCGWYICTLKDYRVNAYYWNNKGEWVDNGKKHFFELYNISSRYTGKEITAEQEGSVYWTDWVIAWMPLPKPYHEGEQND